MMKRFCVAVGLMLGGCATHLDQSNPLQSRFLEVEAMTNESNVVALAPEIYSEEILKENFPLASEDVWTAVIWQSLPKRHSYREAVNGDQGCFSANGFTAKGTPATINIHYVKRDAVWLINLIDFDYLNSPSEFVPKAKCPAGSNADHQ